MPERDSSENGAHEASSETSGSQELPQGLRTRLTVAVPLGAGFVVLLSSFAVLWIGYPLLFEHAGLTSVQELEARVKWVFTIGGAFTLVGLVVAIVLAEWLARPLRSLVARVESARRLAGEGAPAHERGFGRDIGHGSLQAVASLLEALVRDAWTLRSLEGGVVTVNQAGVVTGFNPVAERVLGCAADEAIGRPLANLVAQDEANESFLAAVRSALTGVAHASSAEAPVRTRDGREVRLGYTLTALHDEAYRKLGVVLTFKDLSDRKASEQLMRQAEGLALLGSMAFRVAQEIANPLTVMTGLVELIRDTSPANSPHREHCGRLLEALARLRNLAQELLTIGDPVPRALELVDLSELARTVVAACREDPETRGAEVQEQYAANLPPIPGDRARLAEVVRNIVRNACQAVLAGGGKVSVATELAGQDALIVVRNSGPAIPAEVRDKLFTAFFPPRHRGTGLGLALSQQIVKAHGGLILVETGPERGTAFTIRLPLAGPMPAGNDPI